VFLGREVSENVLQSIIKQVVRKSLGAAIESISCHCGAAVSMITDTDTPGNGTCTVRKIRILKKIFFGKKNTRNPLLSADGTVPGIGLSHSTPLRTTESVVDTP
jgi:hypothetical protein